MASALRKHRMVSRVVSRGFAQVSRRFRAGFAQVSRRFRAWFLVIGGSQVVRTASPEAETCRKWREVGGNHLGGVEGVFLRPQSATVRRYGGRKGVVSRRYRGDIARFGAGFAVISRGFAGFRPYAITWYRKVSQGFALLSRGIARHTLRYIPATLELSDSA